MLILQLLNLGENFEVLLGVFEILSTDASHIVKLSLKRLLSTRHLLDLIANFFLDPFSLVILVLSLSLELLLLSLDLHESAGILIVVFLQLLQLSTLLEQGLTGGSALILQDLLLLKVGSLRALLELVAVILVTHLQVVERVRQSLDLLLALADLTIELVTIALEFFFLLSSLDDIVSLRVLTNCLNLT
jgi:hypothetical protein